MKKYPVMRQGLYTKNSVNVQSLGITFAQKTHLLINILL